jgi:hypothetical protein
MRQVDLKQRRSPNESIDDWVSREFANISEASRDRPEISSVRPFVFDNFDVATDARVTYDPATVSLEELAQAFATFVNFMQRQGPKRTS